MMGNRKYQGVWVGSLSEYPLQSEEADQGNGMAYTSEFCADAIDSDGWVLARCSQNGTLLTMIALQEHAPTAELN
jgi:hypothetical protein